MQFGDSRIAITTLGKPSWPQQKFSGGIFYPAAIKHFPNALSDVSIDQFYASINHVAPSLIRVEADEATYNLHIIIRFQLEQELIEESLSVDDLPESLEFKVPG